MPLVQTRGAASAQGFGEFAQAAGPANYIEDVFSTWLYTGNATARSIINSINLSGYGGLVWTKARDYAGLDNYLVDTVRGRTNFIVSNSANAQIGSSDITAFRSDGYSLNADVNGGFNNNGTTFCSWTFREQPKFFDVVTYTGNGANRTISHNLGSVPGMIIVKRTDASANWQVYHRSLANTEYLVLNSTAAVATGATRWNSTTPTSSVFSLGTDTTVNANAGTYVAYLFAHNAGGFGLTGTDNVISCGSFTTAAGGVATINLGYEPQYVLAKRTSGTGDWNILDVMRGMPNTSTSQTNALFANTSGAEVAGFNNVFPTSTGFYTNGLAGSSDYIYMAIRRPMKVPTDATTVFSPNVETTTTSPQTVTTGFPVDLCINTLRNGGFASTPVMDRLRGGTINSYNFLNTASTAAESTGSTPALGFDNNTGLVDNGWLTNTNAILWNFRRASGFFDVVCYTGNGSSQNVTHNLGVAPELMLIKSRNTTQSWITYSTPTGNQNYGVLNTTVAWVSGGSFTWNNTTPTNTVFSLGSSGALNGSGDTYVAYLFATCPGVSKVGSYTGNGTTQAIACGFTSGARFVLIKRTDSTGDWYVYDTARGMTLLTDPYLRLNSTAAESATLGSVITSTGGFTVDASILSAINTNAASYIFLAIA
jgi:hypothetical protein